MFGVDSDEKIKLESLIPAIKTAPSSSRHSDSIKDLFTSKALRLYTPVIAFIW